MGRVGTHIGYIARFVEPLRHHHRLLDTEA